MNTFPFGRFGPAVTSQAAFAIGVVLAATGASQGAIVLGTASSFAVLGASTVRNTGSSVIVGNLGVSPGTALTGFPPGTVREGTIHLNDAVASQARVDATMAYNTLAGLELTLNLTGQDLGGLTLTPGVYRFSSSAQLTGALTLNGLGQADPLFVFQIGSTLTTASASSILFIGGAYACNTFFQVGSSATLGTATAFAGTIIALASNTLTTGASVDGRIFALNGAVTLDSNRITLCVIPAPSAGIAGLAMLVAIGARRTRQAKGQTAS